MYIEQLYTGCLAEAAYYIESEGEAAIIDPLRETKPYTDLASKRGASIKYVFETHFHADFISGHIDLAAVTGAQLVFGPGAQPGYASYVAEDNEDFDIGNVKLRVIHTPGHTIESTTYLLIDEEGKDHAIFTGDTLFIGDVGRPDLAVKGDLTQEDLAGMLYDSLHNRLLTLDDEVILYPGHGAGSQCGKHMSSETVSTIGQQRKMNYALQPMTKGQFIEVVTEGLDEPPAYFPQNARINREGYANIEQVMQRNLVALSIEAFKQHVQDGAWILDTRDPDMFEKGFIPQSLNIGLNGQYAVWVGSLIPFNQRLVLVSDPGKEEEAVLRLARVGYENVAGYLEGGIKNWQDHGEQVEMVQSVEAGEVPNLMKENYKVLDVRRNSEVESEHLEGAINVSLKDLKANIDALNKDQPYVVHCAGGYRSMIASSILKSAGYHNVANVRGGFKAMKEIDKLAFTTGKCPAQRRKEQMENF